VSEREREREREREIERKGGRGGRGTLEHEGDKDLGFRVWV
jgi:hypothetical protein